jgi:ribosomal protein S18 acetylase RimI-like enzyme
VGELRISDADLAQQLVLHEARAQQATTRELRDLGDGWLLHDPTDAEPFWNRLIAPRWPVEPMAFDRRLDEMITLFATLARLPHVRPLPAGSEPADMAARLEAAGFEWLGADRRMVLEDRGPALDVVRSWQERRDGGAWGRVSVTRHPGSVVTRGSDRRRWVVDASLVLAEAFGVDPLRRTALESDVLACVMRPECAILLISVADEPVAIARRATTGEGSYLSSIGTRPAWRGRGLGTLATALAMDDALGAGSTFVHLAVEVDNEVARRLYSRLGFAIVGEPAPDLLLR